MRRVPRGVKPQVENPMKIFKRLMAYVFQYYKFHYMAVIALIFVSVLANVQGTMFMKNLIDDYITPFLMTDAPDFSTLANAIARVACFYGVGILSTYTYNRIMINVTQGTLRSLRDDLFAHMERLPIKYFDTHAHGDIMSVYTNDIDTLRQMISQSIPQVVNSGITIVSVFVSMVILSIPLTAVTLAMVAVMILSSKAAAGRSGKYFLEQQKNLGAVNGYIEEMMNGQKVVKVFCHEEKAKDGFDGLNEALRDDSAKANSFANIMGPVMNNLGHLQYALIAIAGGALAGMAVGLLACSFTTSIGILYTSMISGTVAGIFFGFLLYSRTPDGRPVGIGSGHFFQYLLAKGFPTAITVMQIGVAIVLAVAVYNVSAL